MKRYAGLDVPAKETSICVVDDAGAIRREFKAPTDPRDISVALNGSELRLTRIGLEAGPLSQWLYSGLAAAGLPVICIETRHTKAFLKAQVNKSDRNDARGIVQTMRVNLFRPVHVKTDTSQRPRALLRARKLLQGKALDIENEIRGLLRNFGFNVGVVGAARFEQRVRDLLEDRENLALVVAPLLAARAELRAEFDRLHLMVLDGAGADPVRHRLMPVTALASTSSIDIPARFRRTRDVGPALGLTPVLNQSGASHRVGRISLCGDAMTR